MSTLPSMVYHQTINESQLIQALPGNIVVQSYQDVPVVSESVCSQGDYCLADSTTMTPCPPGKYNNLTNGNSPAFCLTCPSGAYCPQGSPLPVSCGAGYYNWLTGQGSIAACRVCPSGSYCQANTTTPVQCAAGTYNAFTWQGVPGAC